VFTHPQVNLMRVIWLDHYNICTNINASDWEFISDGKVGGVDYTIWHTNLTGCSFKSILLSYLL
jgi:hypothetical protein